ncbi:MBOAT family O-acyltransferase [Aliikangiella coralliicola]|uniref:Probable alginate O-acetylase n=1 Tax=Aliikangiella coralliicola TaxID=2592383 RepID=A0A545U0C9_9GAMM|nr:MBOAT family O-acyltransferase [Aliikangiella coralliicola]TQV82919.1 MBOAT family protein [Aliikangiella coralliicola]
MIFNTPIFFAFFIIFLFFYGFVFLRQTPKVYFTLVASLVFYGAWNYNFIPLLVGSAIADYFIAQAIGASSDKRARKGLVTLSIAINLGILGLFKYADFVLVSVADFLTLFNYQASLPALEWILPVGISFYTFQSLSYTIDVYRGDMKPRKGLVEFTAALSFFPQLVAGPILRARQILPQMHAIKVPQWEQVKHGFLLITVGLMKKTTADLLAGPAQLAFDAEQSVSLIETWTGVLAFAGQIYGDFSGYSDMAIGLALLLGFQIPLNFRVPYFALSPVDFWRRWHISLSTWLRDYLYISLGGNRNNRYRNVMLTMLLGGLWHGAAWTFLAWGVFHGIIISVTHYLAGLPKFASFVENKSKGIVIIKWAMTFYLVLLGWVLFRAPDLSSAWLMLIEMHGLSAPLPESGNVALLIFGLAILALLLMHLLDYFVLNHSEKLKKKAWLFWSLLVIGQGLCLLVGEPSNEFIYFQF